MSGATGITAIERPLLGWILMQERPRVVLDAIERHLRHHRTRSVANGLMTAGDFGAIEVTEGFESASVDPNGVVVAHLIEDGPPTVSWHKGSFWLWRAHATLPETVITALIGRDIGNLVEHPLSPGGSITSIQEDWPWIRFATDGRPVPIERARAATLEHAMTAARAAVATYKEQTP